MTRKQRLVVIGNGMAGARTLEEILARGGGDRFRITVFGAEPYGNYNRILLSNVLNGSQDARDIFLNPLGWYQENGITLHAGVRAAAIDRTRKVVLGENGVEEPYDRLILATGSRPFVPPMDGTNKEGVFLFRTLDDCDAIAKYASTPRGRPTRAAVIGGGLLGLEAARGLLTHGVEVTIVEVAPRLMVQQLDGEGGAILRRTMEGMAISVRLEAKTAAVLGNGRVTGLEFADGTMLDADMVVISCGIRPNSEIARECGLTVERAIVVDDHLRTDDPRIYAVGECVQHRGRVYGLVGPLWEQAQVLADHITGMKPDAVYPGSKVATRLKVMGVELAAMGAAEPVDEQDEVLQFMEPKRGVYKKLIIRDGRLTGAILLGDAAKAAYLMQVFDRGAPLPAERASLLFDLGGGPVTLSLEEMPDDATVCYCNGVSKGEIRECAAGGAAGLHAVMEATRAGTGCGTCKGLVQALVGAQERGSVGAWGALERGSGKA
jgi:nitrite reductase [NAD(P)H] large subunit